MQRKCAYKLLNFNMYMWSYLINFWSQQYMDKIKISRLYRVNFRVMQIICNNVKFLRAYIPFGISIISAISIYPLAVFCLAKIYSTKSVCIYTYYVVAKIFAKFLIALLNINFNVKSVSSLSSSSSS